MSGFGGGGGFGFGSQAADPFGSQANTGFGSGGGFGGAGSSAPPSFGFGSSQPQQQQPNTGFGVAPNASFGNAAPFGQASFGSSTPPSATTFGASPNLVAPAPFGQATTNSFGSAGSSNQGGFNSGFENQSSGFPSGNATTSGFGTFGNPPNSNLNDSAMSNPFGSTAINNTSPATVTFGTSSNVVTNNKQGGFSSTPNSSWGAPDPSAGFGSNPFATSQNRNNPNEMGMQHQSDSEDMADGSTSPFGHSRNSAPPQHNIRSTNLSPINEQNPMADSSTANSFSAGKNNDERTIRANLEEKKRLQAEIEAKKKKLLERKQRKKPAKEGSLSADASPFVPKAASEAAAQASLAERNAVRFNQQPDKAAQASLAERNAMRFNQQQDTSRTRELLPSDIKESVQDSESKTSSGVTEKGREDLKNATSLVGTCQYMCPDDELLRRERENDIQQLEIPLPGNLHPANWALRDTVVKRFRRSAADYKLDVPEWVRPPDVLERVCSYLEEWVMDRDRQGPDPRFPNNQTPLPLDVYQFMWDRTRMIRKDLTLQNYVGTGGKCDARAVRCHERIARWHAMCEHQLSHISDFTKMQSQQNIQELGQTMKTLNQFYDDSLNRSVVEVPDENGKETRVNLSGFSHGCRADTVQGNGPQDFDGSPLSNDDSLSSKRLIGKHAVNHPTHGTAEPEMRGLYILLTIDNDGGMEVLKYAANLFQERPDVYHSKPVQLALSIYKAKKEYNYARFFSILRSPSTPYLFACVMFKYVETMRKIAIRIMSKTFGARKKDTGEAIYDAYPLVRLTELLCFENLDEAKSACKHYNITVKQMKVSSSQSPRNEIAEVVFWRQSDFKIPKHPEKGFELPLQPWKMLRTIEKKLNGATRLAVCRGEVSGEGAALMKPFLAATQTSTAGAVLDARAQTEQRAKAAALLMKQKFEQARLEKEAKKNEQKERESNEARRREEVARRGQEERHLKEERRKREEEAKELAELENQRLEKIREMELRMQREKAIREQEKRKQEDMEERKRLEIEAENARKAEEELRLKEAEARRVQLEQEKARQMKEQAERERKEEEERRLKEYQQRLAEEARQKKIEEERRLKEAEARRLELLRQQIEEQRRKEAEERRKAKEWRDRIDSARKIILWCRWRRRFSRRLEMTQGSKASLQHIDPTFTRDSFHIGESIWNAFNESANQNKENFPTNPENARRIIETLLRNNHAQLCLSSMAAEEIKSSPALYRSLAGEDGSNDSPKSVLLFKVAVFIPFSSHSEDGLIGELVRLWIKNRLDFERITSNKWTNGKRIEYEIRSVVVCGIESKVCSNCDVALFVLPPPWGNPHSRVNELRSLSSMIDESVPRVALVLGEAVDEALFDSLNELLALHIGGGSGRLPIIYTSNMSVDAYENALESACRKVAKLFVHEACVKVNRLPVIRLASMAVINSLWRNVPLARQSNEEYILECSKSALLAVIEEINTHLRQNEQVWSTWPPVEFSSNHGVESYFSEDGNLPSEWVKSLRQENIQEAISRLLQDFDGSLRDVVQRFLRDAPRCVRDECFAMFAKRQYRRCLEKSLMWAQASGVDTVAEGPMLYIPDSFMELVVQGVADRTKPKDENHQDFSSGLDWYTNNGGPTKSAEEFPEKPMLPPPGKLLEAVSNKRRRAGVTGPNYYGQVPEASAEFGFRDKRRRDEPASLVSEDLQLSAQFSKKLEEMMHGNRTVDLPVGESSLTRLMRGVPSLDLETM